jgi:hypothetical protein
MFRDGAYKSLTQGWSDFVGDSLSKVVLKPDGAEIFTKPTIPGEIPYVTDETEEDSSDDSLSTAAAAAAQSGLTQAGSFIIRHPHATRAHNHNSHTKTTY